MNKLRKSLVVSVMVLTVLATSGVFNISAVKASASAGDLIKMSGNAAVYYLGADGKRYVFPNSTTYNSWYADFSGVVTIPATELQSYLLGGNIVMRPGTKMVKITTDPSVYAVEPNGVLRKIQSEAQAAALYGTNWNKMIVDVADSYFTNYTIAATPLANGSVPAGSLVKNAGSAAIYYYDGTNYRSVATEAALTANRFSMANVLTLTSTITAGGTAITGAETALVKTSQGGATGTTIVVTGSGLMVSLNANTAAATTIINSQSIAPLTSFNLTAANDGAITVKSIKLQRIGVSSDNTLSNIYLYNGTTKLTDAGSLSSGHVTFSNASGIVTIPAGQTVTLTVRADVDKNATGGNIGIAINSASDIVSTGANVSGSFPLNGNLMAITSVTDLAAVTVTSVPTGVTAVDAGTTAATLWSDNLNVSQKAVKLSYVSFRQIGSISDDAIQNLNLYVNGTKVGVSASIVGGRVNFDLSAAPVLLNTGASTVELRGDIVKGSNYNFTFSIQTAADMVLTDTNYGVNVAVTGVSPVSLPLSPVSATINHGSVSIQKDVNFTATQFVANQSQTVLGQWTMKAYGEDEKIQSLQALVSLVGTSTSAEGFNNVSVYVNGATVGSSQNAVGAGTAASPFTKTLTFGSTNLFTIPAGTQVVVAIKGDSVLNTNTQVTAAQADLIAPNQAFQGVTSFTYTPAGNTTYTGTSLTTGSSAATVSANGSYTAQTLSANTTKQKIGSYMIQASSIDGVNVTSVKVGLKQGGVDMTDFTKIANLYVVTPDMANGSTPVSPSALNNFSTNFTVLANQTAQVDVYADLSATSSTFNTTLAGSGNGYTSHQAVTLSPTTATGQNITVGNGSLYTASLTGSSPVSQIVVGGANNQAVATYNLVASTNGGVTISELGFAVSGTAVSTITVGGQTASVVSGKALVTGLNLIVPASYGGLDIPVTANFAPVGINGVADQTATITFAHVKYLAGGTTTINDATTYTTGVYTGIFATSTAGIDSKVMQIAGVAPIVSLGSATGNLTTGVVKIGSVTVVAPTGNAILKNLPIVLTASGATLATSTAIVVKDASNNADITTTGNTTATGVGTSTITFNPNYTVSAGTAGKTFDIYVNVASIAGNAGTGRVTLGLGDKSLFTWTDVNGNADLTAAYILNFPNTTVSIVN